MRSASLSPCRLPTALSSSETHTRCQVCDAREKPREERSSPSTSEKQTVDPSRDWHWFLLGCFLLDFSFYFCPWSGWESGSCKWTQHMNKARIRGLSRSPLRRKRSTHETGRGETQTRTKDSPLGLDVQPQQSLSAEPVPRSRAARAFRQPGLWSDTAAVWISSTSLTTLGPSH